MLVASTPIDISRNVKSQFWLFYKNISFDCFSFIVLIGKLLILLKFQWIYDKYEDHFLARGFPWDDFLSDYVVSEWGPKVKLAHIELNKADVICRDYGLEAVKKMASLSLPEVWLLRT